MNGDVRSAGTIVAAILENMGLLSQESILNHFYLFFQSGGALVYMLVVIGAIVSFVIFGSYRMGIYLLVAPGLFAFLLYTRATVDPVQWKLGGSEAVEVTDKFVQGLEEFKPRPVKVSWFFAWYTRIINGFVNSTVDMILANEEDHKLLFLMRDHVLGLIRSSVPTDEGLTSVLVRDLYGSCSPMMNVLNSFAHNRYTDFELSQLDQRVALGGNNSTVAAKEKAKRLAEIEFLKERLTETEKVSISASPSLRDFLRDFSEDYAPDLGMSAATRGDPDLFAQNDVPLLNLTCGQIWTISKHMILNNSEHVVEKILRQIKVNLPVSEENERKICVEIADKINKRYFVRSVDSSGNPSSPNPYDCDLAQVVGLFMIRNIISNADGLRQNLQTVWDKTQFISSRRALMYTDNQAEVKGATNDKLLRDSEVGVEMPIQLREDGKLVGFDERNQKWRTFEGAPIYGYNESAYRLTQVYRTGEVLERIFNYALNLPYWQGVLLYLLALSFPFTTVLVLMPNRLPTFFVIPLLWLWVKSWDIGFAMVMVLDRMVWNLLPSSDSPYNPFASTQPMVYGGGSPSEDASALVRAALSVDPLFHVHVKYHLISLAVFLVPGLTGWLILKTKRAVLSSFTDAPQEHSDSIGTIARQTTEVSMMHELMQSLYKTTGAGTMAQVSGQGMTAAYNLSAGLSNGAVQQALTTGGQALGLDAAGNLLDKLGGASSSGGGAKPGTPAAKRESRAGLRQTATTVLDTVGSGAKVANSLMETGVRKQVVDTYWLHKELGRHGHFAIMMDASLVAAADGAGYELMSYGRMGAEVLDRRIELYEKTLVIDDMQGDLLAKGIQTGLNLGAKMRPGQNTGHDQKKLGANPLGGVAIGSAVGTTAFAGGLRDVLSGVDNLEFLRPHDPYAYLSTYTYNTGYQDGFKPQEGLSLSTAESPTFTAFGEHRNIRVKPSDVDPFLYRADVSEEEIEELKRRRRRSGFGWWDNRYYD